MVPAERKQKKSNSFAGELLVLGSFFGAASYGAVSEGYRFDSFRDYCLLWVVCLLMGIVTTPRPKQRLSTAMGILVIPYSLHCLYSYDDDAAILTLLVSFGVVFCYSLAVLIFWLRDQTRGRVRKKKLRCFQSYLFRCRRLVSFVCTAALAVLIVGCSIIAWQESRDTMITSQRGEALLQTVGDNKELIRQFHDRAWKKLDREQRISLLQQVADAECSYLGLPYSLHVCHGKMERDSLRAYYLHKRFEVCINQDVIDNDSVERVLSTLFHEVFHAFEYAVVEAHDNTDPAYRNLRLYENAWIYAAEFDHYIGGEEDFDAYSQQAVERDSNIYAQNRLQDYREMMAYLRGY